MAWAALVIGLLVLAVWVSRHFTLTSTQRDQPSLRSAGPDVPLPPDAPKVSVVVPARNEEHNIGPCLQTLLAQNYPDFEIIVVDDRSTDRTSDAARTAAAGDRRVRVIRVEDLPDGWFGKSHAMQQGAAQAAGQWLLFVDADCRQAPGSIRAAMAHMLADGGDMLSLWPLIEMHSFGENLVQPLCGSILALYFRPQWVNDPRRKAAFANGQFILVRSTTYEAVGGHASVRNILVEDIAFARVVKGAGFRLRNAIGIDLFSTRMYDSLRAAWRGWTRIFSYAFRRPVFLLLIAVLVLLFRLLPYVTTVWGLVAAARAGWSSHLLNAVAAVGFAELAAMISVLIRYNRMARSQARYLAIYPVSVLAVEGILLNAALVGLGLLGTTWRGTAYRAGSRVAQHDSQQSGQGPDARPR